MTEDLDLDFISVTWNRVYIHCSGFTTSGWFQFKGASWCMDCGVQNDFIFLDLIGIITQHFKPPTLDAPWTIYIVVQGSGRILKELCQRVSFDNPRAGKIWRQRASDIERVYPEFRLNRELTFIVTIDATILGSTQPEMTSTHTQTASASTDSIQTQTIPFSPTTAGNESPPLTATVPCLTNLSKDFAKLLDDESDADVEFHCDTLTTKAHRTVACARSPVLAKMLKSNMSEGKTGIVKIQDMDADTFRQLLRYLYTGQLEELTFETAVPIYEAADQYEVLALASRCSEFISKNLTAENAYDVLVVADAHSDQKFVEAVVDYMARNTFPMTSDRWSTFCDEQPKLSNKVFKRFCEVSKWNGLKE